VNIKRPANFTELSTEEQKSVDAQLNEMIRTKYTDINYNGLNRNKVNALTGNMSRNPFDNAVVIIDEAHNFVSRIVNKIKTPDSISYILYDCLLRATNAKIILLTGTPIINYPNEIGILYNILRGYIKSWSMTVNLRDKGDVAKVNTDAILSMLDKANFRLFDFVEYSGNKLTVTRNPFGFINSKKRGAVKGTLKATKRAAGVFGGKRTRKSRANKSKKIPPIQIDTDSIIDKKDDSWFGRIFNLDRTDENVLAEKVTYPGQNDDDTDEISEVEKAYRIGYNKENNPYTGGGEVFDRYDGVRLDDTGNLSDADFIGALVSILKQNGLDIPEGSIEIKQYKCLPDESDAFMSMFVNADTGEAQHINLFQRRILGLTSYFRSAQEQLLPRFVKTDDGDNYHVIKSEMSDHQFDLYSRIRKEEADREKTSKKRKKMNAGDELFNISSTYRIFSRAACNFVFPDGIDRPIPVIKAAAEMSENAFDAIPREQLQDEDVYSAFDEDEAAADADEEYGVSDSTKYMKRIEKAMQDVSVITEGTDESTYLNPEALRTLSPKLFDVLENLTSEENEGLHLLYSHFRTIEGIGIMRLILLANGFAEFKIQKAGDYWDIIETEEDAGKPTFVLYTGTETVEEKEIIRNVYNGAWEFVPATIAMKLRERAESNNYGEVIKLLMITSSGAEGINLKNTRFVHILEPYWHMVRVEQVVGRARRICSHQELPEEMRTVKVFLYVTTLSEEQKTDEKNIELRIRDLSRIDKKTPVTTDETLYEIASMKQRINGQILQAVKETAIDCNLYSITKKLTDEEQLVCYGFGKVESNQFSSYPAFERDREEKEGLDLRTVRWRGIKVTVGDTDYALNEDTGEVYDLESYNRARTTGVEPILLGRLTRDARGQYRVVDV
jgi:hypothetical protein